MRRRDVDDGVRGLCCRDIRANNRLGSRLNDLWSRLLNDFTLNHLRLHNRCGLRNDGVDDALFANHFNRAEERLNICEVRNGGPAIGMNRSGDVQSARIVGFRNKTFLCRNRTRLDNALRARFKRRRREAVIVIIARRCGCTDVVCLNNPGIGHAVCAKIGRCFAVHNVLTANC